MRFLIKGSGTIGEERCPLALLLAIRERNSFQAALVFKNTVEAAELVTTKGADTESLSRPFGATKPEQHEVELPQERGTPWHRRTIDRASVFVCVCVWRREKTNNEC
jgi:hypothetical protein